MRDYDVLTTLPGTYEDDVLLTHGDGLTDIVKAPRNFGDEPSEGEYRTGAERILRLIAALEPMVLVFAYKRVLDQILRLWFERAENSRYGFNP